MNFTEMFFNVFAAIVGMGLFVLLVVGGILLALVFLNAGYEIYRRVK